MTACETKDIARTAPDQRLDRRATLILLGLAPLLPSVARAQASADPLPSWRDGSAKRALLDFVAAVTAEGGPDFVRAPERIAVFDNDGTLWVEQPIYTQFAFAIDRLKEMAARDPGLLQRPILKAAVDGDMRTAVLSTPAGVLLARGYHRAPE